MRKKLTVALAAVLVLAFAGIALAVQKQSGVIKFSKSKAGGPTAIDSTFKVADAGNTKAGQVGKPTRQITRVDIQFPKGMVFNYKVKPVCKEVLYSRIVAKCKKAKLATGTTAIDGRGGNSGNQVFGIVKAKLTAYNAQNTNGTTGLRITVVTAKSTIGFPSVLSPVLKGNKLITQLPSALKAIGAYLTDFHLKIPIAKGKVKGKTKYYAVLPKKCPKSKKFNTTVKYYFDDGGKPFTTAPTKNKCTAAKKK